MEGANPSTFGRKAGDEGARKPHRCRFFDKTLTTMRSEVRTCISELLSVCARGGYVGGRRVPKLRVCVASSVSVRKHSRASTKHRTPPRKLQGTTISV